MSIEIDWSKAPEGTTHTNRNNTQWFDFSSDPAKSWFQGAWARNGYAFEDYDTPGELIERPAAWNGEGLPPVGTVCEHFGTADHTDWIEVQVIGHGHARFHDVAFFEYLAGTKGYTVSYSTANNFRALRTAEQIAAEERKKAINELCANSSHSERRKWAAWAYDKLGYRKQAKQCSE